MCIRDRFVGEDQSPGMKRGGALNVVRYNIEVKCPAGSIPDNIEVDISGLEIGDAIHLSEVKLPANVTPGITDRDVTIATIVASRTSKTEDEEGETEGEGEEAAEGEADAPAGRLIAFCPAPAICAPNGGRNYGNLVRPRQSRCKISWKPA